ncbi:hypothetical protein RRG08_039057 [Elysia crispata]|uniref:Uncharacterized protein n=1 Tax=Elysia crispata TaxID=231223 RepID=A0AAE1A6D6_9GAST|nr:hypothetical protein RRG08_039057 [Elysia crispata]
MVGVWSHPTVFGMVGVVSSNRLWYGGGVVSSNRLWYGGGVVSSNRLWYGGRSLIQPSLSHPTVFGMVGVVSSNRLWYGGGVVSSNRLWYGGVVVSSNRLWYGGGVVSSNRLWYGGCGLIQPSLAREPQYRMRPATSNRTMDALRPVASLNKVVSRNRGNHYSEVKGRNLFPRAKEENCHCEFISSIHEIDPRSSG